MEKPGAEVIFMNPNLDSEETAKFLKTTRGTLANWRWKGEGPPYFKLKRKVLYSRETLESWLKKHTVLTEENLE